MSCMIYHIDEIKDKNCQEFLRRMETIVLSDYQLIYKFVDSCHDDIQKLKCGRLDKDDDRDEQGKGKGQVIKVSKSCHNSYSPIFAF
jgi:golgi apparatus protein 1